MNNLYKSFFAFLCLIHLGFAEAQTTKGDVLNAIDQLYESIAQSDKDQTDYANLLQKVLEISGDLGQTSNFVCMKSGNDWYLYDSKSGSSVGSGSYLDDCNAAVDAAKNGLVCMKSGNDWYLYNSKTGSSVGSGSYLKDCNASVSAAKNSFVCMKAGNEWYLYDSKSGSSVGSGSSLDSCNASL